MQAQELMTHKPVAITPMDTVSHAAALMRDFRIGCLPVVEQLDPPVLIGLITDRDITVRCVAKEHPSSCRVRDHMSANALQTVRAETDSAEVLEKMDRAQVRRIPVVNKDNVLLGIIAQADLATKLGPQAPLQVESMLERISAPVIQLT